jgi:hypothetical protein
MAGKAVIHLQPRVHRRAIGSSAKVGRIAESIGVFVLKATC